jgi:squalene-hopene/tetraprenyl-beta-curcumene cyclase
MALAYFGKLDGLQYSADYGKYVYVKYTYGDEAFDSVAPAPNGTQGQGAYGDCIIKTGELKGNASKELITAYLEKHGLRTGSPGVTQEEVKKKLREGSLIILSTQALVRGCSEPPCGHIVLLRGYTDDGYFLVNDPYGQWTGQDPYGYGAPDPDCCGGNVHGAGVSYKWDEMQVKWVLAVSLSTIDKGLQWLRTSQKPDGSWSESTGVTALALLSFFNAGVSPGDATDTNKDGVPDIQKGMAFLASKFDQASGSFSGDEGGGTSYICYDTALCILGLIAADRASGANHYQAVITRAKDYLLSVQLVSDQGSANYGGWGYPRAGWADLSNTQWVVMALNAANDYLGLSPALSDSSSWAGKLVSFLQHCQMSDGGFDYQSGWFKKSVGSMSMAGLWSLLLAGVPETDQGVVHVREWIQANYTLGENPGRGTAALYYYYVTLAKALTMASWATVTDSAGAQHNWYSELAAKLGTLQKAAGNWVNDNSDEWENNADLCTAYALLALETQQLPSGEQLSWVLTLHSPGTLHVYAPDGAHVGPSNAGAGVDEDIPGSSYIVSPDGEQVISISGLEAGSYRVELVGTTGGAYTLESVVQQSGRDVSSKSFTGSLVPGQVRATNVVFTAMEGAATQFMNDLQAVPSGLTATPGNQTVSLSWRPFSETGFALAGYNVYRSTATGGGYSKITTAAVSATSYRDAGLTNDVTYYYVITAVSSTGSETPYSRQVNATPTLAVPGQTGQVICGPNPVGPAGVAFYYQLPEGTAGAEIVILDLSGRLVFRTDVDPSGTRYPAGGTWDPVDLNGVPLGNGPYSFVLVVDGKAVGHGKMVIQR